MNAPLLGGLILGLVLRVVSGNSFRTLGDVRVRAESLVLLAILIQVALPLAEFWSEDSRLASWLLLQALVGVLLLLNPEYPSVVAVGVGFLMNGIVVLINGGMPVDTSLAGGDAGLGVLTTRLDYLHVELRRSTHLVGLADVLPIVMPFGRSAALSIGDLFIAFGVGWLVSGVHSAKTVKESDLKRRT